MKEEELNNLKNNSKVSKFHELENKLYQYSGEYNVLSEKFNYLRNAYGEYIAINIAKRLSRKKHLMKGIIIKI